VWETEINKSNLNEIKEEFKDRNNRNINWTFKNDTINGRTTIEWEFYRRFIPEWASRFDLEAFKEALKEKN
jgi:hypothetical protein